MLKIEKQEQCCGCSACAQICPNHCILMVADEKGFLYPLIDKQVCVNCRLCEKVCPMMNQKENSSEKISYAANNKDETIRKAGSSGGLFAALADDFLLRGGVVFGAALNDDCKSVKHIAVENREDLKKLYGSKYLQSVIGNAYKLAQEYLNQDRFVLFSGTSCQINGLRLFLNKDYEKLITVDVICHGTPSPKVWADYIGDKESKSKANVISATFRNKRFGWHRSVLLLLLLSDGSEYCKSMYEDNYMKGFLRNLYLRDSCYNCKCKGKHMMSDVTLGDFWGVETVLPNIDAYNGISAVILNTEKGKEAFNQIKQKLHVTNVDYNDVLRGNPSLQYSVSKPLNNEKFWKIYESKGLEVAFKQCLSVPFFKRGCRSVKRIIKWLLTNIR